MEDGSSIPGAAWKGTPRECRQSPGGHLLQNPDLSHDCTEMDTYPEALGGSDSIHPVIPAPASMVTGGSVVSHLAGLDLLNSKRGLCGDS